VIKGAGKGGALDPSLAGEQLSDWDVMREVYRYVQPRGNKEFGRRVGAAMALLVGAKALNVQVPFFFKYTGGARGGSLRGLQHLCGPSRPRFCAPPPPPSPASPIRGVAVVPTGWLPLRCALQWTR